ncbi:LysR family transcriptional regulator [Clostridium sp. 19966]|uniref:LysR family transcriptional regulator n=1 Tax=Clostridium sp. 19966 TaxID=2768166 RepID=UPI0028DFFB5A|nr:LysR family transcriptional regulator [Clostridium sp. 19966]MDT8716826.1 LysR family transcriptional regulator [Clostridium sp. 19966]
MDFHQWEYIIAVAEEKSISRAAEKLYISQPSLSQYIIRLENSLGVKLFNRRGNSITLTFAGEKYIRTAKNIINLNEQLQKELSDIVDSKMGRIRIGIPIQTGRYVLPLILPEFHKQFPEVEIVIEEDVKAKLEELLISDKIDIAIIYLPIQYEQLDYEAITREKIFLVAPERYENYIKNDGNKIGNINFDSFKQENFILFREGQKMREASDEIFKKADFNPKVLFEVTNLDTAHRIAIQGMGCTFIPENILSILNIEKDNNYFLMEDIEFILAIAYRKGEYISKVTQGFIDISKSIMAKKYEDKIAYENYIKVYIKNRNK